jgi:hypothetical protein
MDSYNTRPVLEYDIPAPAPSGKRNKYHFREMPVGASFLAPGEDAQHCSAVWAARSYAMKNPNYKFVSAKDTNAPGFVRIWRVPANDSQSV